MFTVDTPALGRADVAERWRRLMPTVPDDPRAEMDEFGELYVSPIPANRHQRIAHRVAVEIERQLGGTGLTVTAISTRIGVRVPDACWTAEPNSTRFDEDPASTAPEICVELASPSNSEKWLLEKAAAYLEAGAREVIIVEVDGRIRYFDANGERSASAFGLQLPLTF